MFSFYAIDVMDTATIRVNPQTERGCSPTKVAAIQSAIKQGILSEEQPLAMFYNLTRYR